MKRFERYVAIGDSTTEGLEDPDGQGGYRGWANRFAEHLAARFPGLQYANLAVRGLTSRDIRTGQLAAALAMRPDVATVVAGVNDLLRPTFDAEGVAADIRAMIDALTRGGAMVLTFTMPDLARVMPSARLIRGRLLALNARLAQTCAQTGAVLVDLAAHDDTADLRLWHDDRLHANALGHERIALALAHAAGLPGFEHWSQPLPSAPPRSFVDAMRTELRWSRQYLLPWLVRHAKGQSSGDGRRPKRPTLAPL